MPWMPSYLGSQWICGELFSLPFKFTMDEYLPLSVQWSANRKRESVDRSAAEAHDIRWRYIIHPSDKSNLLESAQQTGLSKRWMSQKILQMSKIILFKHVKCF